MDFADRLGCSTAWRKTPARLGHSVGRSRYPVRPGRFTGCRDDPIRLITLGPDGAFAAPGSGTPAFPHPQTHCGCERWIPAGPVAQTRPTSATVGRLGRLSEVGAERRKAHGSPRWSRLDIGVSVPLPGASLTKALTAASSTVVRGEHIFQGGGPDA